MSKNYLERIPMRPEGLMWEIDDENIVTLSIENKGFANKIAQKLLKKPKISYIHLDELGSFVWTIMDGKADIIELGEMVLEHFGEKCEPVYERLAKYFQILSSYGFVNWKDGKK